MQIENHNISIENPIFLIAEISANHNNSIEKAKKIISAAKESGANAVKLQTYTPDTLTIKSDRPEFRKSGGLWKGRTLYDLFEEAHTPFEWHEVLFNHAKKIGITCFSSPFDKTAVELLEGLSCPAYKVASFELIDHKLIEFIASTGKPILMSTGAASDKEIFEALNIAYQNGAKEILLFHCISSYPAYLEESNLRSLLHLREKYNVEVGLSDHTLGAEASMIATSLGASAIEKHFTLSRNDGGPDSAFSIEPKEFKLLRETVDKTSKAIGKFGLYRSSNEDPLRRRSLYYVKN